MIQITMVEDQPEDARILQEHLKHFTAETSEPFSVTCFSDPQQFLAEHSTHCDLVFLDIELPGMSGMDCARRLREKDPDVILIFVTNLAQYALHGYEVNALDFIVKPVSYPQLNMKLKRAVKQIRKHQEQYLNLNIKNGFVKLPVSQIFYLEVQLHYITYHTEKGDFTVRETMKSASDKLEGYSFARANNSFLVNLRHVSFISDGQIHMNGKDIYLSRSCKAPFMKALTDYIEGNI